MLKNNHMSLPLAIDYGNEHLNRVRSSLRPANILGWVFCHSITAEDNTSQCPCKSGTEGLDNQITEVITKPISGEEESIHNRYISKYTD